MKLSIVIAIYQSQEIVRRQAKYFSDMNLPDDIEFIFVDDGSTPPLGGYELKNLKIHYTNDKRPWTQGLARNAGVKIAEGEYILCTDIDHILSKEAIMDCYNSPEGNLIFPRYFGVLLEDGKLSQEKEDLIKYGIDPTRFNSGRGLYASYHGNTYCMKRSTFWEIGGNSERRCTFGHHAGPRMGEDAALNRSWNHWMNRNGLKAVVGSPIYIFPIGRYHVNGDLNPLGLFHPLSEELVVQPNKN